jgi:predicted metalloprotease
MRWQGRRQSSNIDDRRRGGRKGITIGGGIGTIILLVLFALLGGNPLELLQNADMGAITQAPATYQGSPREEALADFVGVVLADTEDVWNTLFAATGSTYQEPTLVLYSGSDRSGCGFASAATGPFYCPADQSIYIDLSFYQQLKDRFNAPGDFAMAYVIAHEVGHHIQRLLGITDKLDQLRGRVSQSEYNALSVRLELQADFLAGVWAHHAQQMKNILEEGDIEEALQAANAIGDDRLQMQSQGYVVPDSFTHGTSEQRMHWFMKGYTSGDLNQGDTFSAEIR